MKSGRRFGMLRKVCAVAVASVLAAGCLTACGSSKNTGPLTLDQIKENGKLTVATEAAYEPFEYMDGDKIIGYNADLFAKICDDLGVELDYIDLPFQGILAGLEAKKYDVVGATLGVTAERADKYTMTYPIQNGTTVFVKRKGDDSIKSIEDMSGKKVGTQTSCYNEDDTKKFNECKIGDTVRVMETRPLSKDKRWRLVEIMERARYKEIQREAKVRGQGRLCRTAQIRLIP